MFNFKNQISLGGVTDISGEQHDITGYGLLNSLEIHTNPSLGMFGYNDIVLSTPNSFGTVNTNTLKAAPMFSTDFPDNMDGSLILPTEVDITTNNLSLITIGNRTPNLVEIYKGTGLMFMEHKQVFGVLTTSGTNGSVPANNIIVSFAVVTDGNLESVTLPAGTYRFKEKIAYSFINARYKNLMLENDLRVRDDEYLIPTDPIRTYARFKYRLDSVLPADSGYVPTFKVDMTGNNDTVFEMRNDSNLPIVEQGTEFNGPKLEPILQTGTGHRNGIDFYVDGIKIKDELVNVIVDGDTATIYANLLDSDYIGGVPTADTIFEVVYFGKYILPAPVLTILEYGKTNTNEPYTDDVLANAIDPNGLPLTVTSIGRVFNGTATIDGSNVTFTPTPDFLGTAEVYYEVSNGQTSSIGVIRIDVVEDVDTHTVPVNATGVPMASLPIPIPVTVATADTDITTGFDQPIQVDVLANDEGDNVTITSVNLTSGNGIATIVDNKVQYTPTVDDMGSTVTIDYSITGDNGDDSSTITITVPLPRFVATFKTENVGDVSNFECEGDFYVDYGDGNWVGPVTVIDQPSVSTGNVRVISNNGVKVRPNDIFTDIHVERCDDMINADHQFRFKNKLVNFTAGPDAYRNTTSMYSTWRECYNLTSFPMINTSSVTYMVYTWYACELLTSFPAIDTSSVITMDNTWRLCSGLTSFPMINTSSVTSMRITWHYCSGLTSFPLIDTSKVTNLYHAWHGCSSLTSFPLIDTSSVLILTNAWRACTDLTSFPLIDTSTAEEAVNTWKECSSLTEFPELDFSNVTNMNSAWYDCNGLTSFPLIDTSKVTNMRHTWYHCTGLTSFPVIDTSSVVDMTGTWYGCENLTSFPAIDTSNVTNMNSTWRECIGLTSFPLIDTSSVTNVGHTWRQCTGLTSFPAIDTSNVVTLTYTWMNCGVLESFPMINTSNVTNMVYAWRGCYLFTEFPTIDTSNVTNMRLTWTYCRNLAEFPLLDTSNVTNMGYTWYHCDSLTEFPAIDTSSAVNMYKTWTLCTGLAEFPLLDTGNVTNFEQAWRDCVELGSFPAINMSSATTIKETWRNCNQLTALPVLNTSNVLDASMAFKDCTNLSCIGGLDTTSATTKDGLFDNTTSLTAPTSAEQTLLMSSDGHNYVNPDPCPN